MQGHLVNGTMVALEQLGVDSQSLRMLAISETGTSSIADLHNLLADHRVDTMLLRRDGILYLLLIGADDSVQRVATLLPATARVGASEPFTDPTTTPIAAQQARWALGASTAERPLAHFGRVHSVFGARTPEEATLTVSTVLGPIIDYDLEHSTELLKSLRIFLHSNRSWKRAADELFIHKQTLMYRMRRVEDITGRKLNNTSDVAELWLALRAEDSLL
jgi:purine catabolism regulator